MFIKKVSNIQTWSKLGNSQSKNKDTVFKWKDRFTDSTEKYEPEKIKIMFETIKCRIVTIVLIFLVKMCESMKLKIFNTNASNVPWDDFYSFSPFWRYNQAKSNFNDFIVKISFTSLT